MFNDKFGLTKAVLEGRKTMTRRSIPKKLLESIELYAHGNEEELRHRLLANSSYQVGEVVAIAQSYETLGNSGYLDKMMDGALSMKKEYAGAGYKNKMFVKAKLMPHHIKITNIRVERLQDISDEDCLREGIYEKKLEYTPSGYNSNRTYYTFDGVDYCFNDARDAFAALIDKVSGRGTWDNNPLVWVYEFELVD